MDDSATASNTPGGSGIGSSGRRRALREGEWACVDARCAHINADRRSSCEKCGKAKPRVKSKTAKEIGKEAAEKSKGLFSAEDWVCAKCGNVNWARRSTCNICNAPRVCETEIRTGYGGGYMDRQVVEYKERREDDEEFDEFGRKKKSKKQMAADEQKELGEARSDENEDEDEEELDAAAPDRSLSAAEQPEKLDEGDEDEDEGEEDKESDDEEEDEGDDEDIAKYDLFADPELASLKINLAKQKVAEKNGSQEEREDLSSECSCSCSGGECSCSESDDEVVEAKRSKLDENDRGRARTDHHRGWERRERESPTRGGSGHYSRNGREHGARGTDDHHSRTKHDYHRGSSREQKRSRDEERSRERHHHRH